MARNDLAAPNFADYFMIGEAAEFLGVSAATLRNWDRSGKLKPRRHPQNGYRIYLHEDLAAVLQSTKLPKAERAPESALAAHVDWSALDGTEHYVQFYESDACLLESMTGFVAAALSQGERAIVVATPEHRRDIATKLAARDLDLAEAEANGQYIAKDARDTLSQIMVDDCLDEERFNAVIGQMIARLTAEGQRIRACGEMAPLLWASGNRDGAIALEQKWSELSQRYRIPLLCTYPIRAFSDDDQAIKFERLCSHHTHVQPAESFPSIENDDARMRAVSRLQQQIYSLRAEIEHRQGIENSNRDGKLHDKNLDARISTELQAPLLAIRSALGALHAATDIGSPGRAAADTIRLQVERLAMQIDRLG